MKLNPRHLLAGTVTLFLSGQMAWAQDLTVLDGDPLPEDLESQNIDPNNLLLEALASAAKRGPIFRISPDAIFLSISTGEIASETVRVSNTGDEDGKISGINMLGAIDGVDLTNTCPAVLAPGAFCDIAIRFASSGPTNIQSAILGTINERDKSNFDVPVQIKVEAPPEPVVEITPPQIPTPATDTPELPERSPEEIRNDVAQKYMRAIGRGTPSRRSTGFTIITAPEKSEEHLSGVSYSEISREVKYMDDRYPAKIRSVEATLPVNRDMILTSDRVIKAVLDTPVSNVMCGKVVAVIESDVYSATSRVSLIPAGSRAIGKCAQFAGERAGIAWERIITTDGRSISFDGSITRTSDASGLGGGLGRVYQSKFDQFVLPILSSVIDTAAGLVMTTFGETEQLVVQPDGTVVQSNSNKNEGIRTITESVQGTSQQIISEIRDIRKVLVLPAGSRIDIEISEDVYFRNEREVVRLADVTYDIENAPVAIAPVEDPEPISLEPWRNGEPGPVIVIDGQRYIVREGSYDRPVHPSDILPAPEADETEDSALPTANLNPLANLGSAASPDADMPSEQVRQ